MKRKKKAWFFTEKDESIRESEGFTLERNETKKPSRAPLLRRLRVVGIGTVK